MKTKIALTPRGVRLSEKQWSYLENRAAKENEKNPEAKATPSDVVRHAVDKLMNADN